MTIGNPMPEPASYGDRYKAHARAAEAKRKMDDAIAALDKAEREWMDACREEAQLDGIEYPTLTAVRGISKE